MKRASKSRRESPAPADPRGELSTELLLLPDGRILVHNLTRPFADLLNELNPGEDAIRLRAVEARAHPILPPPK